MAQPIRTRTRLARSQRRDQIVDAAAEVLGGRDPALVTFEEIADAAGVSRALLYNYFGDRHGLLAAVEQRSLARLERAIADGVEGTATPHQELAATIRAHLQAARRDPAGYRLVAQRLEPSSQWALGSVVVAGPDVPLVTTGLLAAVHAMVLSAIEAGVADRPATVDVITAFVAGALDGLRGEAAPAAGVAQRLR